MSLCIGDAHPIEGYGKIVLFVEVVLSRFLVRLSLYPSLRSLTDPSHLPHSSTRTLHNISAPRKASSLTGFPPRPLSTRYKVSMRSPNRRCTAGWKDCSARASRMS